MIAKSPLCVVTSFCSISQWSWLHNSLPVPVDSHRQYKFIISVSFLSRSRTDEGITAQIIWQFCN